MAELKTKQTDADVNAFLNGIADAKQREDGFRLLDIMRETTGAAPRMWGSSIIGFGEHHYVYASGREGDTCQTGFSPRKDAFAVYGLLGNDRSESLLKKLGKFKAGKGCLYIKRLADIDLAVLRDMIHRALAHLSAASNCQPKPASAKTSRTKTR
jgi:hypothetical protein